MYLSHLKELYTHMQWADATIWKAVSLSSDSRSDDQIIDTLLHLHETQHAFLSVWLFIDIFHGIEGVYRKDGAHTTQMGDRIIAENMLALIRSETGLLGPIGGQ